MILLQICLFTILSFFFKISQQAGFVCQNLEDCKAILRELGVAGGDDYSYEVKKQ